MTALTIRRYHPEDADAVWDLHERALRDVGLYDEAYAHLDSDLRSVRAEYLESGGAFLVGEREGDLVAMGGVQPSRRVELHDTDPDAAVVRRMRVDPAHQRQGYGSAMLDALETRARELGVERLVLDTTPQQTAAMALYESFGYRETNRVETPGGERVLYAREL